jgi:hypothetical protein
VSRSIYWRFALSVATVIGILGFMWRSAVRDPGPTGLPNDLPNWHNRPGDFRDNALLVLTEAAVAMLLIRPWSYDRSWGRALNGAVMFAPWLLLNLMFMIHSGGIMVLHTLWLFALWLSFVGAAAWSAGAGAVNRSRRSAARAA